MAPQAGRPFTITDPNPPIPYINMYLLTKMLAVMPPRLLSVPPVLVLLLSYPIEWYCLALVRFPFLGRMLPQLPSVLKQLQPPLFSICTHLVASNEIASRPVAEGGLGYKGVLTSLEGMVQEIVNWNRENSNADVPRKAYQTSVFRAEEIKNSWQNNTNLP
jgi:hypothetical protein